MAHLALTLDADADRRKQFLDAARQRLGTFAEFTVHSLEVDRLGIVWACGPRAPWSVSRDAEQLAVLLGYAVDEDGEWLDAAGVARHQFANENPAVVGDGFYAAVTYAPDRGLIVSVDPHGMFPWYWSVRSGVLIAATSGELVGAHPLVELEWDRQGLAGIFLANGLVNHQSLFRGVSRLRPGHRLMAPPGQPVVEQQVYDLKRDDSFSEIPFDEACEVVSHELERAIDRHRPKRSETALLLSGGLDSRLMAGYLHRANATDSAVCFGWPHDYEARAAARVGAALNMPVHLDSYESNDDELCARAMEMARWDHGSGGFGSVHRWSNPTMGYQKPEFFWSGYLLDDLIGGMAMSMGRDPQTETWSFEYFLKRINLWGLPQSTIKQLLRIPRESEMLETMISQWRSEYERSEWRPAQRAFSAKLGSRARFHIGGHMHRKSFESWPLVPMLDRRLVHVLFNLNPEWMLRRRLETELLQRGFPHLAAIPFDTNSFRFFPHYVKQGKNEASSWLKAQQWIKKHSQRWYWTHWKQVEPRRYHRLYDLDSPQWLPIRTLAEGHRRQMHAFLDGDVLDRLLPGPQARFRFRDPFAQGAPRRTLLGLMLWHAADSASSMYRQDRMMVA